MPLRYWLIIALLSVGWGATFLLNEIMIRDMGPLWAAFGRVGIGAVGCWVWLIATKGPKTIGTAPLWAMGVFGLVQYATPLAVYPMAQQYITSSAAGVVNAMTPVIAVVVTHFWPGGDRVTPSKFVGVLLGFAGIVLLALPSFLGQGSSDPLALVLTLLAPLCYAIALNWVRRFDGMNRVTLTAWSMTLGALLLLPVTVSQEPVPQISQWETVAALLTSGLVLTAGAFIVFFWLLPRVGAISASTIPLIATASAVILGVMVLNERLNGLQYTGIAVVFVGLLFVDGRILRKLGLLRVENA